MHPLIGLSNDGSIAVKLFQDSKYQEALDQWSKDYSQGNNSLSMQYNMGIASIKLNQWASAIWHLENALRIDPNCTSCRTGVEYCNKQLGIQEVELPQFFLLTWYHQLILKLQALEWFIVAMILLCISIFIYFKYRNKTTFFKTLIGCSLLLLLIAIHRDNIMRSYDELILMSESGLHISPDGNSESRTTLAAGSKLFVTDKIGEWIKIRSANYEVGWLEEKKVNYISWK